MNENIQKILVKIAIALKQLKWKVDENVDVTIKTDGNLMLSKTFKVDGSMNGEDFSDSVEATIILTMDSQDQITFYPKFKLSTEFYVEGSNVKDLEEEIDIPVAFISDDEGITDPEMKKIVSTKISQAANHIDKFSSDALDDNWQNYLDSSSEDIGHYNQEKQYQEPEDLD